MSLNITKKDDLLIIELDGELDQHMAKSVKDRIDHAITTSFLKNVVFDFSGVSLMDSSGIGLIMGRSKTIREYGGTLTIHGLSPKMREIFDLSGLRKIVKYAEEVSQ
ncbi:anti-sigma F factor antagonist [Clostridia bacterium]|nr:anti-sigma F factor antagonist [Clostridia bacterium]